MRVERVSALGKAISDPSRAAILCALMPGTPRTAGQLAAHVGLAASTTSRHLSVLVDASLLRVEPAGRHRYFRLSSPDVADLLRTIEGMDVPTGGGQPRFKANEITLARTCYDHLAGDIGVRLFRSMIEMRWIEVPNDQAPRLRAVGHANLRSLGIDTEALGKQRRPLVRGCLDWEQQARHLGGGLGSALLAMMIHQRWLNHRPNQRSVAVTPFGARQLAELFRVTVR